MPLNMVNRVERLVFRESKRSSSKSTDKQTANKPRCVRHGYSVNIVPAQICLSECFIYNRVYNLYVATRCHLWHNTTVDFMDIYLRADDITQQLVAVFDDCRCSLVTARLYSQNSHSGTYYITPVMRCFLCILFKLVL